MNLFLLLFKIQSLLFLLMKVSLLLKYFLFVKYRDSDWKAHHLIYFPESELIVSKSYSCVKAKKIQNILSSSFIHLVLLVVLTRLVIKMFF